MVMQPTIVTPLSQGNYFIPQPNYSFQNVVPTYYSPQQQQQQSQVPITQAIDIGTKVAPTALKAGGGISTINSGGAALGFGSGGAPVLGGVGPAAPVGSLGTTTTLAGTLGPAALGALGGGALARYTGGNTTGGSVGGALGGAAGAFGAGTASGAALGAALGLGAQSLNFVLPGLGVIAGGVLGAMVGNKEKATSASDFSGTIDSNGLAGTQVAHKNGDPKYAQGVSEAASDYFKKLKESTGIDLSGNIVRGGSNSKQMGGGYFSVDARGKGFNPDAELGGNPLSFKFDPKNTNDMYRALGDSAVALGQANKLSQEQIQKIQQFNQKLAQDRTLGASGSGMTPSTYSPPMIPISSNKGPTFADFAANYRKTQEQGRAQ